MTRTIFTWKMKKAIFVDVIITFISILIIMCVIKILFGEQIKKAINYVNMVSINTNDKIIKDIKFDEKKNNIITYPEYGSRYGNIKIDSLNIYLPLYYGDKISFLRYGIGQSSGAYFPGEGGSIICMGHNTKNFLYHLPEIKKDAIIEINTTYGDFKYKVYKTEIINMYDKGKLSENLGRKAIGLKRSIPS